MARQPGKPRAAPKAGKAGEDEILTSPGPADVADDSVEGVTATSPGAVELRLSTEVMLASLSSRERRCRLEVLSGTGVGTVVVVDKDRVRIGTHASSDLVLQDRAASRQHFELQHDAKGWLLLDLASTNGTWLDGSRVERAWLRAGSQIGAGQTLMRFTPLDASAPEATPGLSGLDGMVGASAAMQPVYGLIKRAAPLDSSVVITGETGTGKELAARALHHLSPRAAGPLVVLDCGAIPESLIESELFGHEAGAFTGAERARAGAFERAQGGTIFLDELGELRLDLQPKLLRVLEERVVRRVGSNDSIAVDVRVVCATHRDLQAEVAAGRFREDLWFRLAVLTLHLPPLRERREDIPMLLAKALGEPEVLKRHGTKRLAPRVTEQLAAYAWPGNVRELMNVVSHVLAFSRGERIEVEDLPARVVGSGRPEAPLAFNELLAFKDAKEQVLEAFEREYLTQVLTRCAGSVTRAAEESGLHRKTLERLCRKHGLDARLLRHEAARSRE